MTRWIEVEDDYVRLGLMKLDSNLFYGRNLSRYLEKHCEKKGLSYEFSWNKKKDLKKRSTFRDGKIQVIWSNGFDEESTMLLQCFFASICFYCHLIWVFDFVIEFLQKLKLYIDLCFVMGF